MDVAGWTITAIAIAIAIVIALHEFGNRRR
jgi:hypothetical protein